MPSYRKNPRPADIYDLTITINDPPGPFQVVEGWVQYQITNMDCLPPANFFSGVQTTPISTSLPIKLERTGSGRYQGRVALDGLINGDYFGHGICRFMTVGPAIRLKATGAADETRFIASVDAEDMADAVELTSLYWRGHYPREEKIAGYPDYCHTSPDKFVEHLRGELFSVTITTARTAQP